MFASRFRLSVSLPLCALSASPLLWAQGRAIAAFELPGDAPECIPGGTGGGWLGPWQMATVTGGTGVYEARLAGKPGAGVLWQQLRRFGMLPEGSKGGQLRRGAFREYGDPINREGPVSISFVVRVEAVNGFDSEFGDSLSFHESISGSASASGNAQETSWQFTLRADGSISYFKGPSPAALAGAKWTPGVDYRFEITPHPDSKTYDFVVYELGAGAPIGSAVDVPWRAQTVLPERHPGVLHFIAGLNRTQDDQENHEDFIIWTLDELVVTNF